MRKLSSMFMGCAAAIAWVSSANAALVISNDPTSNVTCGAGVCSATAANAVLNATDLLNALAMGSVNVESGSDAMDIDVSVAVSWTAHHTLTLTANRSIAVNAAMVAESSGARVVLVTGGGGDLTFAGGSLDFWSTHSHLTINGQAYMLVSDLSGLAAAVAAHPARGYALAKSYDAGPDGDYAVAPVTTTFTGKFEGLGHGISNLTITTSGTDAGLFAATSGASLRDIAFTNAAISTEPDVQNYGGALLGFGTNTTISHVSASGTVSSYWAGGIAGRIQTGSLNDASSSVAVSALDYGGGVIAILDGSITGGAATGTVAAAGAGGLAGSVQGNVTNSFATGNVTEGGAGGGLVGDYESGTIQTSYASGNVSNSTGSIGSNAGGLVGTINSGTVTNAYATGNVAAGPGGTKSGTSGGLVGGNGGTLEHDYAAGTVSGGHANQSGGFAGVLLGSVQVGNFWDTTTGGTMPKHGVGKCSGTGCTTTTGLTTTQLQSGLPAGFDAGIWGSNPSINGGLPYLLAIPPT